MGEPTKTFQWRKPNEVMLQMRKKKKALSARFYTPSPNSGQKSNEVNLQSVADDAKRKNPFITGGAAKKRKEEPADLDVSESSDDTLFKLLHLSNENLRGQKKYELTQSDVLYEEETLSEEIVQAVRQTNFPIDWSLNTKVRFMSLKPFIWNQKLKISEEASGTTGFTRCLDIKSTAPFLDTSPNAKFHQCCLYWQHPSLPWLNLFPRIGGKKGSGPSVNMNLPQVRNSLHTAWSDSLRSLFHLIRTKQCAYFYMCSNTFTVLFRASGVCGFSEVSALITPTTRGLRHMLRQEEIEFIMPLKRKRMSDQGYETDPSLGESEEPHENNEEDEAPDTVWLKSMGVKEEDIKQINYTQEKIQQRCEGEIDSTNESLVLVLGNEVQGLYNFLLNFKSNIAATGPLAGIPSTLLAPVAFHNATLRSLKVRESKVHDNSEDYYSLELTGPILPHTIHNLCAINPEEQSLTATFANLSSTEAFSKIKCDTVMSSSTETLANMPGICKSAFGQAGLSDCGLGESVLERFCSEDSKSIANLECLKYNAEDKSYFWT